MNARTKTLIQKQILDRIRADIDTSEILLGLKKSGCAVSDGSIDIATEQKRLWTAALDGVIGAIDRETSQDPQ